MQGTPLEQLKHLMFRVALGATDVHVAEGFPEGRALQLSLLQAFEDVRVNCRSGSTTTSPSGFLNLTD